MIRWDDKGDNSLWLFTKEEFNKLPIGMELECIDGKFSIIGRDYIDMDTRVNHIAYGIRNIMNHKESELFLTFRLS